jgi:hypothetical protein
MCEGWRALVGERCSHTIGASNLEAHVLIAQVYCTLKHSRGKPCSDTGPKPTAEEILADDNHPKWDILPDQQCPICQNIDYEEAAVRVQRGPES